MEPINKIHRDLMEVLDKAWEVSAETALYTQPSSSDVDLERSVRELHDAVMAYAQKNIRGE